MNGRIVSVVVPCLNVSRTIRRLVHSLQEQELPDGVELEIIAVDNGSTDGTEAVLRALPVQCVSSATAGPAAARNTGIRVARGTVIVLLDADTRASDRRLIAEHLCVLDAHPDIGIAGGAITHDPEQRNVLAFAENATGLFNWHEGLPERDLTFQPIGNQAFARALFDRVGPINEALQTLEDFDWCQRVLAAGYRIHFNPNARVYITGRERLPAILKKFYRWGWNVRTIYLPGRPSQIWFFRDHPLLFSLNAPIRVLNDTWVTIKRWFCVHPFRTLACVPLFLLYRCAWAAGMVTGARTALRARPDGRSP